MFQSDRSTPGTVVEASTEPTVASILGVTGALRFRPHGSTQKAHVILRQVDAPEDADEKADSSMMYFSLFAQKRIEVKPGKEILLAVAAPDGRIIDTPVILAAKVANGAAPSEGLNLSLEDRMSIVASTREAVVPPKMRKTWSKRFEVVRESSSLFSVRAHRCNCLLSEPAISMSHSYASVSVQTQPTRMSIRSNFFYSLLNYPLSQLQE